MKENNIDITEQINFIINAYSTTTIMPEIISEDFLTKLQNTDYSDEETELLCEAIMQKYDKLSPSIVTMTHWMIEGYYNTDAMPRIISKDIITKLEDEGYSDEEIELLYMEITERYDKLLER